jgi:hypothetical protein
MDHEKIKNEDIVDRYILGKLSAEEKQLFEEHYFGCDECFSAVQDADAVILGLKDLARNGELVIAGAETRRTVPAWLKALIWRPAFAYALAAVVLVLVYPAWRGVMKVSRLESEIEALRQPQANATIHYLQQTRAGEATKIFLNPEDEAFVLNFNILKGEIAAPQYRAQIVDQDGKSVWQGKNLKSAGNFAVFSIACRSTFFKGGLYTLQVDEVNPANGQVIHQSLFPFEIVFGEANIKK